MEEIQGLKVGDRVEQMCLTCNEQRGHIVVSVSKTGKVTRVSCPLCNSRVPYKSGGKSGSPRVPSTTAGSPYDRARTYRRGQTMMHPAFGEGEVTAVLDTGKIDVLFSDRLRRLIHAVA